LPWLSILVSLFCGLIAWVIIDPIQSQELEGVFQKELENRLESRAVDTRRRLEHSLLDMEKAPTTWRRIGIWSTMSILQTGTKVLIMHSTITMNPPPG
jgi:hypothetical protein